MHNAFHSGAIINHVMRKMTQVDPKRGLTCRMMLMDRTEDGKSSENVKTEDGRQADIA
jgi:hypothetical protein